MWILFNEYFKSVYDSAELVTDSPWNNDSSNPTLESTTTLPIHISIGTISLSTQIIEKFLNKLDINKGQATRVPMVYPLYFWKCSAVNDFLLPYFYYSPNHEMPKIWKKLFVKIIFDNIFPVLRTHTCSSTTCFCK